MPLPPAVIPTKRPLSGTIAPEVRTPTSGLSLPNAQIHVYTTEAEIEGPQRTSHFTAALTCCILPDRRKGDTFFNPEEAVKGEHKKITKKDHKTTAPQKEKS